MENQCIKIEGKCLCALIYYIRLSCAYKCYPMDDLWGV